MYDPMDPPKEGIPADPLPPDIVEGESGEVTDEDNEEPIFDPYAGTVDPNDPEQDRIEALMRGEAGDSTPDPDLDNSGGDDDSQA